MGSTTTHPSVLLLAPIFFYVSVAEPQEAPDEFLKLVEKAILELTDDRRLMAKLLGLEVRRSQSTDGFERDARQTDVRDTPTPDGICVNPWNLCHGDDRIGVCEDRPALAEGKIGTFCRLHGRLFLRMNLLRELADHPGQMRRIDATTATPNKLPNETVRQLKVGVQMTNEKSPREVVEEHRDMIMKIPGVIGVGVSSCRADPSQRCILVYTTRQGWPSSLPHQIEGLTVEVVRKRKGFRAL